MNDTDRLLPVPGANQNAPTQLPAKRLALMADGTFAEVVVVVNPDGSAIGGAAPGTVSSGSGGGIIGVDTGGTKWLLVADTSKTPATIAYFKVSDGTTGTPVGGFIPDTDQADWEDAGYVLNASGQLTSETQKRGSETRTRTWTYSTDASGNVTATAGAWA
jgi:hypothetical protein